MRTLEEAHVLHQRVCGDLQLPEHANALLRVRHGEDLRSGDDHTAREGQLLAQRQLHVSRARRKVENQVVQIAPERVVQDLLDDRHHHGPSHDVGAVRVVHPAERHAEHVVQLERQPGRLVVGQD